MSARFEGDASPGQTAESSVPAGVSDREGRDVAVEGGRTRRSAGPPQSAGLLMFRRGSGRIEVLLAHPGGPFWRARDKEAWTIPKGGIHRGERSEDAATREFKEETGVDPGGPFIALGHVVQRGGKIVHGWAFEGDCDPADLVSVETTMEWPPRSGRSITIPEIDRIEFFSIEAARPAINPAQAAFLDRLLERLGG